MRIIGLPRNGTTSATEFANTFTTPATAPQVTNKTIAIAQQTNARGAADPSPLATVAGITKIPAPIVELTIFAVRAGIPMPRTSFSSVRSASWIVNVVLADIGAW